MSKKNRSPGRRLSGTVMLFYFLAFLLLAARDGSREGYILCAAVPAMIFFGTHVMPRIFPADHLLLSLTNFLCALGILTPGTLLGLCSMSTMRCRMVTQPAMILLFSAALLCAAAGAILNGGKAARR